MVVGNHVDVVQNHNEGGCLYIVIIPKYGDEDEFTWEQEKALAEMCDGFVAINRTRARNKRNSEYKKKKRAERRNQNGGEE